MLIDALKIERNSTLDTDICIIGAGAAGIILALEFADQPFRVCVLESGGLDFAEETQSLYDGTNIGLPYFPLQTARLRYFGGTTNHWGGNCWPFQEMDFERCEWIPHSGWPFSKAVINPFYIRAFKLCQLQHYEWSPAFWSTPEEPVFPFASDVINTNVMQQVPDPAKRFGQTYRPKLVQARNITVCLHANVTELESDETGRTIRRVRVASLSGNRFLLTAKLFILATGGIENARLLLLSNKRHSAGLGNQNDMVGRFFTDHAACLGGKFQPANPTMPVKFYELHKVKDTVIAGGLRLSPDVQRRERLVPVGLDLVPVSEIYTAAWKSKGFASLKAIVNRLRGRYTPGQFGEHLMNVVRDLDNIGVAAYGRLRYGRNYPLDYINIVVVINPAPNPDSRVTLGTERDQLGQRRAQLDWRLTQMDKYSARRTIEILGMELGRAGLGRLQVIIDDDDRTWPHDLTGTFHHIGTTRMNNDPKQGVVAKNCQVHGVSNLFIAGSSVFPSAGSGTPTFLIIALALRLADHIKQRFR